MMKIGSYNEKDLLNSSTKSSEDRKYFLIISDFLLCVCQNNFVNNFNPMIFLWNCDYSYIIDVLRFMYWRISYKIYIKIFQH